MAKTDYWLNDHDPLLLTTFVMCCSHYFTVFIVSPSLVNVMLADHMMGNDHYYKDGSNYVKAPIPKNGRGCNLLSSTGGGGAGALATNDINCVQ
jgi:hypothetical protein